VIDTTPPETSLIANPANPSNDSTPAFELGGADPGGSGVASFECSVDGGGFAACASQQTLTVADGSHTFEVVAIDGAGNVDPTPASYTWFVDTAPPDTSITAGPANPTNASSASFSFTGSDPGGSGVASFKCRLDGGGWSACPSPTSYEGPLSDGSHTFEVRAIDAATKR
jgi:hypothetical protein